VPGLTDPPAAARLTALRRLSRHAWLSAAALVAATVLLLSPSGTRSLALFSDTGQLQNSAFSTETLEPPSGLIAAAGTPSPRVDLSWTVSPDTYTSGYRILRSTTAGGPYSQIAEVTPRTTVTYADTAVIGGTTYFYVARAFFEGWESVNSNEASATP